MPSPLTSVAAASRRSVMRCRYSLVGATLRTLLSVGGAACRVRFLPALRVLFCRVVSALVCSSSSEIVVTAESGSSMITVTGVGVVVVPISVAGLFVLLCLGSPSLSRVVLTTSEPSGLNPVTCTLLAAWVVMPSCRAALRAVSTAWSIERVPLHSVNFSSLLGEDIG